MRSISFIAALALAAVVAASSTPIPDFDESDFVPALVRRQAAASDAIDTLDDTPVSEELFRDDLPNFEEAVSDSSSDDERVRPIRQRIRRRHLTRRSVPYNDAYDRRDSYGGHGPHVPILVDGDVDSLHDTRQFGGPAFGGQAFGRQPFDDQPLGRQPFDDQAVGGQTFGRQAVGGQAFGRQPFDDQALGGQALGGQPIMDSNTVPGDRSINPLMADNLSRHIAFAAPFTSTTAISDNLFYAGEIFAMYNPNKGTCLSVRTVGLRRRLRLVTERCNLQQKFARVSSMSFRWRPVENNLALLVWVTPQNKEVCARHERTGTRFYACDASSTRYSLSATQKNGTFKIRDAGRNSRCMNAEFHHALRMKVCGRFDDEGWTKIHAGFVLPAVMVPRSLF